MATVDKDFRVKNGLVVEGTTATVNGEDIITTGSTTDNLDQGSTNLYFSDELAVDAVATAIGNGTHTNITITYNDEANSISFEGSSPISDTDDLSEGSTNLYFTNARAQAAVAQDIQDAIDAVDTDDIEEGATNLYFTDGRALSATSAAYDPAGAAATAQSNAEDYADGLASNYEVAGAVSTHASSTTTHGVSGAIVGTSDEQTLSNKTFSDPLDMGDNAIINVATPTQTHHAATKGYVDTAVSGLTWKDSVNLLADSNVDISGDLVGTVIDGHAALDITDTDYRILLTNQSTDSENGIYDLYESSGELLAERSADADVYTELIDAAVLVKEGTTYGSSSWVQSNHYISDFTGQSWVQFSGANMYTAGNGLQIAGNEFSIDTTITATKTFVTDSIDALDTDDIEEGSTNLYFTDARAQAAVATDISDAIDAIDTDDIEEGSSNLYFTDQRAVDALEAVTPNFTEIDINSVATQVAATINLSDTNQTAVYSFAKASYRSAKFIIKSNYGVHTELSEVLVTLDTSDNISITEYAVVSTNGSLADISAGINGTNVEILATATTANTDVTVFGTLIA